MKQIIDAFDSAAGWAGSVAGVTVHDENEHLDFVAGGLTKSLIFHFESGSVGEYIGKTVAPAIDVTAYNEIVVSLWSLRRSNHDYRTAADFPYILDLGAGQQFHIPAWPTFTQISIDISAITSIDRIRIIANHNHDDFIVMSYMVAVTDEIPADIFEAFKDGLEKVRLENWPDGGPEVATLTAVVGATEVTFDGDRDFLSENAVIKIKDDTNTETHMLVNGAGATYHFSHLYDGEALLHSYTAAKVYLQYPIEFGRYAAEAILPGVAIWGFVPTPFQHTPLKDETIKAFNNNKFQFKRGGMSEAWRIVIDVEARDPENIADMTRFVRKYLSRCVVWLNGRDFDIMWQEIPVEEIPAEAVGIMPKMNYLIDIEIVEDVLSNESRVKALAATLAVNVIEQGDIV